MPRPLDFDALMDDFTQAKRRANPTARTADTYRTAVAEFGDWLATLPDAPVVTRDGQGRRRTLVKVPGAVVETGEIGIDHLRCFVDHLQNRDQLPGGRRGSVKRTGKKLSPNTVSNRYRALRSFIVWLHTEGEIEDGNPVLVPDKPPKAVEDTRPALTLDQARELVATCGTGRKRDFRDLRDEAILRVFFEAGGRRSEVARAQLDWLNLDQGVLHVSGRYVKTNEGKQIPLCSKTRRAIQKYLIARARHPHKNLPDLWLAPRGPFGPGGVYQMVRMRGRMIGLTNLHPHMFRHSFANIFLDEGGEEADLKRLGGWNSDKQVRHYSKARSTQRAQAAHARLAIGDRI